LPPSGAAWQISPAMAIDAPASLLAKATRPFEVKTKAKACRRNRQTTAYAMNSRADFLAVSRTLPMLALVNY
jgi:hypothetical protein